MLKKISIALGIFLCIATLLFVIYDEPLPEGEEGIEAEILAEKMLKAVNFAAWDSTVAIKWSFHGGHDYLWDKKRKLVQVKWDQMQVLLNTADVTGKAYKNGRLLESEQSADALQKAWKYFINDSFWLAAPFKIKDPGTKRSLVKTKDGDALLVHYSSGGVTPGDSYLWILDEDGSPALWKLWVEIIPIGGMAFSWEKWQTYTTGARLATLHNGIIDVEIFNVQLAMDVVTLNNGTDPFEQM